MLRRARNIGTPRSFRVVGACSAPVREQHVRINNSGDDWPLRSAVIKKCVPLRMLRLAQKPDLLVMTKNICLNVYV